MIEGIGVLLVLSFTLASLISNDNNTQDWSGYTEPGNRFALKYPSSWQWGEDFDIMKSEGIKFYESSQDKFESNEIMQVGIGHRDLSLSTSSMRNITTLRLDSALFINKFKTEFQNFSLEDYPDFNKYRIDEHRTFYFGFTFEKSSIQKKALFIGTDISNSIFYVLFTHDRDEFKSLLPVIDNIIDSTKINNISG